MGGTGYPDYKPVWKPEVPLPPGFTIDDLPRGVDGLYDQINVIDGYGSSGSLIAYHIATGGRPDPRPLIGDFVSYNIRELVLKFEVFTPKSHPVNGAIASIAFPPRGNGWSATAGRDLANIYDPERSVPIAWFVPFEASIDRSRDTWTAGVGADAQTPFFTDWQELEYSGQWMTISIPLSTFRWNPYGGGPFTMMQNDFAVGAGWATEALNTQLTGNWDKDMGEFVIMWEAFGLSTGQDGRFLFFVDNFRVVPDDGGGVQFGKAGQRAPTGNPFSGGRPFR